jgi:putative component of membrane protein insertase Oxa1/YidC/SpoIIIJ protein YidD
MFRFIAVSGIRFYQKHLSSRKGYKCAHGVLHQNGTCSSIILNIVKENSITKWKSKISEQFSSCKQAKFTIDKEREEKKKKEKSRFCDTPASCGDCGTSSMNFKKCDDCTPSLDGCDGCDIGSC